MSAKPTFEQAQLHLQVYDQRRESRLRQARDWFFKNYFADNWGDAMRTAAPGTEGGTNFMMVVSYWEQACALLNYGLLHDDLLRLRRLKFVREQFFLAAAAQNIKRLVRFLSQGPRPPLAVSN